MGHTLKSLLAVCFLSAVVICLDPLSNDCRAATLHGIDVVTSEQWSDVLLRVDGKIDYQHDSLPASETLSARCYIDLYDTSRSHAVPLRQLVDDRYISKIRSGIYATKLRIVLDLKEEYECSVARLSAEYMRIRVSAAARGALATDRELLPQEETVAPTTTSESLNSVQADFKAVTSSTLDETVAAEQSDSPSSTLSTEDSGRLSAWGWMQFYTARDTQKDRYEDHELHRLSGRTGADWEKKLNTDDSLEFHAAVEVDRIYYDSAQADDDTEMDLRETYLQFNRTDWDLSFGKQRVRWGKSDQLSPVDSINPQDFRQFITVDLEERALPNWMLRSRWHGDSVGLETIIQPWFKESELEYFDSDWALYRNLRQSIMNDPQSPAELQEYARNIRVEEDKPSDSLENLSAAARFTLKTEQTDFALSYHYGWETMPTITSFPVKNINYSGDLDLDPSQDLIFTDEPVLSRYKRQQTVGFEWETVLDPIGFRGEIAHIDHVAFLTSDFVSKRKPVTHLVSGVDYISTTEWYFNVQGSWMRIHDHDKGILFFEEDTVSVLGEINKPVWRGNLELAVQYNYTISDQSSYLKPYVTLKYFRNLECEIGANLFSGDDDTLLGSYDKSDQVYGVIKYSF